MECLHDLKLSPFENTRPCVARHNMNNKIENMIPFSIMIMMMMIVTRRLEVPPSCQQHDFKMKSKDG
jgi:hypothetical protein